MQDGMQNGNLKVSKINTFKKLKKGFEPIQLHFVIYIDFSVFQP